MAESISTETTGMRLGEGYGSSRLPVNTIAYLNWTGDWEDGPAPTALVEAELKSFLSILRKNKIRYKKVVKPTSNIFCMRVCILALPEQREQATKLALEHQQSTKFLTAIRRDANA